MASEIVSAKTMAIDIRCDECGKEIINYHSEIGYDGPEEKGITECDIFIKWVILCKECIKR